MAIIFILLCTVHMRTCATAKLEIQRTAGTTTPGEGGATAAGHTKLLLYCCWAQETGAPEDTRGDQERHQGTWGTQETPAGPEGTAGGSGETPRGPEGTTGGSERAARPKGASSTVPVILRCNINIVEGGSVNKRGAFRSENLLEKQDPKNREEAPAYLRGSWECAYSNR